MLESPRGAAEEESLSQNEQTGKTEIDVVQNLTNAINSGTDVHFIHRMTPTSFFDPQTFVSAHRRVGKTLNFNFFNFIFEHHEENVPLPLRGN